MPVTLGILVIDKQAGKQGQKAYRCEGCSDASVLGVLRVVAADS